MNSSLLKISLAIVSTLGLVSCAADSPSPPEQPPAPPVVPDAWALSRPLLLTKGQINASYFEDARDLINTTSDPIPASSFIVFASLEKDISAKREVSMLIKTNCASEGRTFQEQYEFHRLSVIPVRNLLPIEYLADPMRDPSQSLNCSFQLEARNWIGSTHTIQLPNLHIRGFDDLEDVAVNSALTIAGEKEKDEIIRSTALGSAVLHALTPSLKRAFLACDHFRNERPIERADQLPFILQQLLNDELQPTSATNSSKSRQATDPRSIYTQQTCRVLLAGTDQRNEEQAFPSRWLSRSFTVRFPQAPLTVQSEWHLQEAYNDTFTRQPVFRLTITNPSATTTAIRIPEIGAQAIYLQHVDRASDGKVLISFGRNFDMKLNVTGESRSIRGDGYRTLELAAESSILIETRLDISGVTCNGMPKPLPAGGAFTLLGFQFQFAKPFRIERYLNWDGSHSTTGPNVDITPEEFRNVERKGWLRHEAQASTASLENPPAGEEFRAPSVPLLCLGQPMYFDGAW